MAGLGSCLDVVPDRRAVDGTAARHAGASFAPAVDGDIVDPRVPPPSLPPKRSSLRRNRCSARRPAVTSCPISRKPWEPPSPAPSGSTLPSMKIRRPSLRRCQRTSGASPSTAAAARVLSTTIR